MNRDRQPEHAVDPELLAYILGQPRIPRLPGPRVKPPRDPKAKARRQARKAGRRAARGR